MRTSNDLTIVSSCTGYAHYLSEWVKSIIAQPIRPAQVCLFTHGSATDAINGNMAVQRLRKHGFDAMQLHDPVLQDLGVARNRAVAMSSTSWVMHLDCDDTLLPCAIDEIERWMPEADVIQAGYLRTGQFTMGTSARGRLYTGAVGLAAFNLNSMASGVSPFRRALWEQSPYRTDMLGAWDTALWFGFARLGARFVPTSRPIFNYRQHNDSVFNKRRRLLNWVRVRTTAQLKSLRRKDEGIAIILPLSAANTMDRSTVANHVRQHYAAHHPEWPVIEGICRDAQWSKGLAIADALRHTTADVLVLADADCIVDPTALETAVQCVASSVQPAAWAMPHSAVYRANAMFTEQVLARPVTDGMVLPEMATLDRVVYDGCPGGGIVVIRRVWYDAIGGFPAVFKGWGLEDRAFALICETLLGPCARGDAPLLHLYHVPQPTRVNKPGWNLPLLRSLGMAAHKGRDELVKAIGLLPKSREVHNIDWKARMKAKAKARAPQPMPRPKPKHTFQRRRPQ